MGYTIQKDKETTTSSTRYNVNHCNYSLFVKSVPYVIQNPCNSQPPDFSNRS